MSNQNLTISRDNALKAYKSADKSQKYLLELLFGADTFKQPQDVRERIKTFKDACNELGQDHPLVKQYQFIEASYKGHYPIMDDSIAYIKLRIINTALNGGWEPQFTKDEPRYYPWFSSDPSAYVGLAYAGANAASSYLDGDLGSRLVFKTRELAEYAGRQFIGLYADFMLL